MKIILASSEGVPFSKTGGLADVSSALAKALAADGNEVSFVLPHHRQAGGSSLPPGFTIEPTGTHFDVNVGGKLVRADVLKSSFPASGVSIYLIDQPAYFDRPGLYQEHGAAYQDNCERFVFFSRATMELARALELAPDVIHANDWQTGLIPALLKAEYVHQPGFENTSSVFTIHNMEFQGQFWHWDMNLTGLDWKYFNWTQMEYYGDLNLLKTGIVFADIVTTVSPTYAKEIQTPEYGCGLHGVLQKRSADLVGILNGVDTEVWNPATDETLSKNYSAETVTEGKSACKAELQKQVGLPERGDVPLFGMISRMTNQKGFDLICASADELLSREVQFTFLGTGESEVENYISDLSRRYPEKVAATIGFNDELAHRIEAGSDAFLMPSRFEPCGLNQMYSQAYGTLPVVRSIGGLADSVVDATETTIAERRATGFRFDEYHRDAFAGRVGRAAEMYHDKPVWKQMAQTGMRQDWSWKRSAREYLDVYERARDKAASGRE